MSHHRLRADSSTSGLHDTHPGDGPPLIGPRRVPAENAEFTEAVAGPPSACGCHPLAGRPGIADTIGPTAQGTSQPGVKAGSTIHLAGAINGRDGSPVPSRPATNAQAASQQRPANRPGRARAVRSWPLLILALPAAVAVWSGWVGIGQMTGFGQIHPLPGIWDSFHLDTAVTLPVGVEAYAAYALRAWLSASTGVSARTRRFARWSAFGSLVLGMAGQIAYHLLAQDHAARAPWGITTAVSCLPVLILGMGAALAHLLRADAQGTDLLDQAESSRPDQATDYADHSGTGGDHGTGTIQPERLAEAAGAAALLSASGSRISRRTLRTAGVRGSNAYLGALARIVRSQPTSGTAPSDFVIPTEAQ
jgi:hypothetical protein